MPAPVVPLPDMIRNYLGNRQNFYETLLTRLPEALIRKRMEAAVAPLSTDGELNPPPSAQLGEAEDEFLTSLMTLDLMKKPTYGFALGRTTISIDEALDRAMIIEEMGIVLFAHLTEKYGSVQHRFTREMEQRKHTLANLLRLHDELRYHRLSLIPSEETATRSAPT